VALGNEINRVRILFKYAYDAGLIDHPIRYGASFKRPSRKVIRIARAKAGPRMFEANELRAILDAAPMSLKAMVFLGVNCGYGNADCASVPIKAMDLKAGWIHFPRPRQALTATVRSGLRRWPPCRRRSPRGPCPRTTRTLGWCSLPSTVAVGLGVQLGQDPYRPSSASC